MPYDTRISAVAAGKAYETDLRQLRQSDRLSYAEIRKHYECTPAPKAVSTDYCAA